MGNIQFHDALFLSRCEGEEPLIRSPTHTKPARRSSQAPVAGNGFRGFSILPLAMQSAWRNMTLRGPFVISTALEKDRAPR